MVDWQLTVAEIKHFQNADPTKKKPARRENKTNTRKVDKAKKLHVHGVHFIW